MFLVKLFRHKARVLKLNEALCRALYNSVSSLTSFDIFPPDMIGKSELLTEENRKRLCGHLTPSAQGHEWSLLFSTSQHGFWLKTLYQRLEGVSGPVLVIIRNDQGEVFGALLSCALQLSHHEHIYGTGESFLFRLTPEFKVFKWTGSNMYFIQSIKESFTVGGGDGKVGLWLDGDLDRGRSQTCKTYNNEPLSSHEDFHVMALECWGFP